MPKALAGLEDIDLVGVEAAVGSAAYDRGRSLASGRVLQLVWDAHAGRLTGTVIGQGGLYHTVAYFDTGADRDPIFTRGECACPVGHNCKHVAALVIAASSKADRRASEPGSRSAPVAPRRPSTDPSDPADEAHAQPPTPERPPWEQALRELARAPVTHVSGTPLAVGLDLQPDRFPDRPPRLMARLMRPGARGDWINGSLTWNGLDSWEVRRGEYRPEHVALARELYALHVAQEKRFARPYSYSYSGEVRIDLGGCDSAQLWALLDEADRIGLEILQAPAKLGQVRRHDGELHIDVRRGEDGGWLVSPVLRVDGEPFDGLDPAVFIGERGHGVVLAEHGGPGARRGGLRLVRLARPAPPALQRMLLDGEQLAIPEADFDRFADEISPGLRSVATVVSSDGSFSPPEVSPPTLVLRVHFGDAHAVQLGWGWAYTVGERTLPAEPGGEEGFRDREAERALLAGTDLADTGLDRFGLLEPSGRPAIGPPVSLTGLDSMRLVTEELPRLQDHPALTVETIGEPADYRDVGDRLTVGLSTADIAGERDWFDLGVTITVEGQELPFAEVFAALASGEEQVLLEDGAHFSLLDPRLQSLRALIEEAAGLTDSTPTALRVSRYQAGLWAELSALGVVTDQADAWQRQADALLQLDALPEREPPASLAADLRPYQREGFAWLASLWELQLGGILADDMGLGKTVQTLALICHAHARNPDVGPFLVLAPTSVVSNWVHEAARFAPGLRTDTVPDTLARSGRSITEIAAGADIVVTTYTLLRLESERYAEVDWAGLILDEAQYVKNHQAKTYASVRRLPTPFKLAITGTPMENNLMELWSLLSITAPGLFPDPKRFAEAYSRPIERGGDAEALARLRRRIKPLVKRRSKELVAADLPPKQQQTLEIDLHPRHRKLYDTHLQRERQKVLGLIDDFARNRLTILRSITLLRQLSLHPGLVDPEHDAIPCNKIGGLVEQLQDVIGGGHRALVFSQFTGFLGKVRERLDHDGIGYCYLDGRTRRRDRVLDRFKDGTDPVFLISLKAGGSGLNLTEADYCFLLDPWWNPATEAQAIDRTHRIGQTRPVMVYRMVARDTIEEKVVALAQRKAALFSGVMDDGDLFASGLTAEDIRGLVA